ncbi:MAG: 30S ribosomal protein S20 [Candidatus Magasanikbacteria bacterium]
MPIKKHAKKALRQDLRRTAENLIYKKAYKKALKDAKQAIDTSTADVQDKIKLAQKKLDKAAKKGVIKAGAAGRYLSRLMIKKNKVAKK